MSARPWLITLSRRTHIIADESHTELKKDWNSNSEVLINVSHTTYKAQWNFNISFAFKTFRNISMYGIPDMYWNLVIYAVHY